MSRPYATPEDLGYIKVAGHYYCFILMDCSRCGREIKVIDDCECEPPAVYVGEYLVCEGCLG